VEKPTYVGALQAWDAYQAEYITVPLDENGLQTEALETALRGGPKFVYVLPNFHNPTGVTLALDRRRQLVELAERYGVPLIEDDPYGQLRYEGQHLPPLVVLDGQLRGRVRQPYSGNVLYLSTFSKTLAPGLRLGWIIAPPEVIQRLVLAKQGADLHSSTLIQMIAYEVARSGFLDRHVRDVRRVYRERRDSMLAALSHYFPATVRWTQPQGGLFLWVTLPESVDAAEILHAAIAENVAFVPGAAFFADGSGRNTFRLNFSYASPAQIKEGIRRLGSVLHQVLAPETVAAR
jgi:2-aminoadipate transaminase